MIQRFVCGDHVVDGEILAHAFSAGMTQATGEVWVGEQSVGELLESGPIADFHEAKVLDRRGSGWLSLWSPCAAEAFSCSAGR